MEGIIDLSRPVLRDNVIELLVMTMGARSVSYLAAHRCRDADRYVRRRALAGARAFLSKAARSVGQQALQLHATGTPAAVAALHYSRRLAAINATLGDVDSEPPAFSEQLREIS
jgi:alkylation response protein AidB-like acyl-CoA dehydrogenase